MLLQITHVQPEGGNADEQSLHIGEQENGFKVLAEMQRYVYVRENWWKTHANWNVESKVKLSPESSFYKVGAPMCTCLVLYVGNKRFLIRRLNRGHFMFLHLEHTQGRNAQKRSVHLTEQKPRLEIP